jgi:glutamyl-tRNA reductase
LILGAGKIAELTARHLTARGVHTVFVANRTRAHAETLAAQLGGHAIRYEELPSYLRTVDIVISSTSAPHMILPAHEVAQAMRERNQRPLCLLDIAMPRDIDPAAGLLDGVHLYTLDDLRNSTDASNCQRCAAIPQAEAIIDAGLRQWRAQQIGQAAASQIAGICTSFEQIRQQALQGAAKELSTCSPEQRRAIERLTCQMTQQMAHAAITRLKDAYAHGFEELPVECAEEAVAR